METYLTVTLTIAAYLIGSISFSYILAKKTESIGLSCGLYSTAHSSAEWYHYRIRQRTEGSCRLTKQILLIKSGMKNSVNQSRSITPIKSLVILRWIQKVHRLIIGFYSLGFLKHIIQLSVGQPVNHGLHLHAQLDLFFWHIA